MKKQRTMNNQKWSRGVLFSGVMLLGSGALALNETPVMIDEKEKAEPSVVVVDLEKVPDDKKAEPATHEMMMRSDEMLVIVANGGNVLDAVSAIVAQLPSYILSLDLLNSTNELALASTQNKFSTSGKRIPWKKAMEAVLKPLDLYVFEDGTMVKIGTQDKVQEVYAQQSEDQLRRNRTRLEGNAINFSGGTHIYIALRTIRDLAGVNMNLDYMAPEYRVDPELLQQQVEAQAGKNIKKVEVSATTPSAPKTKTTYTIPPGQKMEWRQVLREVLDPIGYTFIEDNGTVKPMPKDLEAKMRQAKIDAMPLVTKFIRVHHAKPEAILEKLKKLNLICHARGFIDVSAAKDEKQRNFKGNSSGIATGNSGTQMGAQLSSGSSFQSLERKSTPPGLVVADIAESIPHIEEQIKLLDVRERQVLIEALIMELSERTAQELGVKWGDLGFSYNSQNRPPITDGTGNTMVNLTEWNGMMGLSHFAATPISFDAIIKMVSGDSYSRLLSNPTLTLGDHVEAAIQVGQALPVPQLDVNYVGSGSQSPISAQSLEWLSLQTGILLWVLPEISADGKEVRLCVHPQITTADEANPVRVTVNGADLVNYKVSMQELDTRVTVPSGGTLLLGGLIKPSQNRTTTKVPWLGDIPLLGWLFRYSSSIEASSHLVILIRPTVLDEKEPNTGYEKPALKVSDELLKKAGVGKELRPDYGKYIPIEKEKKIVNELLENGKKSDVKELDSTKQTNEKAMDSEIKVEKETAVVIPSEKLPIYSAPEEKPLVIPSVTPQPPSSPSDTSGADAPKAPVLQGSPSPSSQTPASSLTEPKES